MRMAPLQLVRERLTDTEKHDQYCCPLSRLTHTPTYFNSYGIILIIVARIYSHFSYRKVSTHKNSTFAAHISKKHYVTPIR